MHLCLWVVWGAGVRVCLRPCVCVCILPVQVAAEVLAEISVKYKIIAVPTVLFVKVGDQEGESG